MHQAQWSPERPLPPPVSLASQSHHILCEIIGFAVRYDAKSLEIEGLDTCEPFLTEKEIADIIKKAKGKKFYQINKISLK